ncbi:MAG: DNA translocase FtsK [Phycisphaerae bacterium]|nr:DNA translocase FtsK [Gemmatimonadaceae bacterium]
MRGAVLRRELTAVGLSLLSAFLFGALIFQHVPASGRCWDATGVFGPVGTIAKCALVVSVGMPGAALIALACLVMALRLFGRLSDESDAPEWGVLFAGIVLLVPIAIGLATGASPSEPTSFTGLWGGFVAFYMRRALGPAGAGILFVLGVSALTVATLRWNPIRMVLGPSPRRANESGEGTQSRLTMAERLAPPPEEMPAIDAAFGCATFSTAGTKGKRAKEPARLNDVEKFAPPAADAAGKKSASKSKTDVTGINAAFDAMRDVDDDALNDELPPTSLLAQPPARNIDAGIAELDAAGRKLMDALRTFKVDGTLVGRTTGPTVTQFEIEPAPGVKVRQIAMLADDLALAMRAASIRIVAPIPGRGAVGVEVPNPVPEIVVLREVLESADFRQARAALPIALGKDLEGRAIVADLAKMPHLLIAGTTGSGKSVCVNTIITSLVYRHTPKTLRFLMVDPKMVELSVYNTLPHLRHKVITDNRDAASVLKWAVMEMQDRYRLLEANACRNLQEFNKRVQQHDSGEKEALKKPRAADVAFEDLTYTGGVLPYIVVIIDEMADLMMTVQGEVETPIAMLAQKARAIGIHLILATQRPSVNVITGLIKANFPSRIAFRVATQIDSRTIIDGSGAESLLGNGDMLFIPPGKSEPSRLQGAYLSSEDTEGLLRWFEDAKARRLAVAAGGEPFAPEPDILEAIRAVELRNAGGSDDDADDGDSERDTRFREAAECVIQHKQGSTSLLQRRLKVGYGRAARMIDQLEEAGILSPSEGASRPRDVLVGLEDLDRICGSS